mgnify:CR=1 FL=1
MSLCVVDKRDRAGRLRKHIEQDERVIGAERVLQEPTGRWSVEATLAESVDGFPSDSLFCLGFPVVIYDVSPQGHHTRAVLLV